MKRITKIEENKSLVKKKKLRVAAYCRVSTASDEQLVSLRLKKSIMKITSRQMMRGSLRGCIMMKG